MKLRNLSEVLNTLNSQSIKYVFVQVRLAGGSEGVFVKVSKAELRRSLKEFAGDVPIFDAEVDGDTLRVK